MSEKILMHELNMIAIYNYCYNYYYYKTSEDSLMVNERSKLQSETRSTKLKVKNPTRKKNK